MKNKSTEAPRRRFTQEQFQQEFNYLQAERITKKLLAKHLITEKEYRRIMAKNRKSFPTFLSPLLPSLDLVY